MKIRKVQGMMTICPSVNLFSCRALLAVALLAGSPGLADLPQTAGQVEASGACRYARWLLGALDAMETDLPAIAAAAEAAAQFYVVQQHVIRAEGDRAGVGEVTGRSGGLVQMGLTANVRVGGRPLILYILREGRLADDEAALRRHHHNGSHVVVFGRAALLRTLEQAGAPMAAAIDTHAADGGLFVAADERAVVATVPAANAAALWTWISEFVAACARLGHMPPIYEGYHKPGGKHRALRLTGIRFHTDLAVAPEPAGQTGLRYLDRLRPKVQTLMDEEIETIRMVGAAAARRIRGDTPGTVYTFLHGHSVSHHELAEFDPGHFEKLNTGWSTVRDDIELKSGDLVFCIGYNQLFRGKDFEDWDIRASEAGAKLAWSIATFLPAEMDAVRPGDWLIRQPWSFGDALVEISGYDVSIAPASGVLAEAVYGMVAAETYGHVAGDASAQPETRQLPETVTPAKAADMRDADRYGRTVLHLAAARGDAAGVESLLGTGADPDATDRTGETPLHRAARADAARIVELLLSAGGGRESRVEARDVLRARTPLHIAAEAGSREAIRALLAGGASVAAADKWGMLPVHLAAMHGDVETLRLLTVAGAELDARDSWGRSVLHWAAQEHHTGLLAHCIANGVSPNVRDRFGRSALYDAAGVSAHRETLTMLLDAGADPAIECKLGLRPTVGTWPWVGELLQYYIANPVTVGQNHSTAVGDWGHFLSMAARVYLHNPDGRAFRFTVHLMRWPIAGWSWNSGDFPLRVTAPDGRVLIEEQVVAEDNSRTFDIPAGPAGSYVVDFQREGNARQMVNVWLSASLERSVAWTGNPDTEGGAFANRWLVTQPSVPRRWWFWVPPDTRSFTVRTQRDIGNTQREAPGITVFTPRGQRIAVLYGHPYMAERIWPGDRRWRGHLERTIPVEPGNAGRFWAFEIRLGDAHNYANINVTLDGVPPYVARSPEEWFNPETGAPAPVTSYDDAMFMQSVADEKLPFQMWSPSPALGDPDGIQVLGPGRFALWNPEQRVLRYDVGDYLVRRAVPDAPDPVARVRMATLAGETLFETGLEVSHHHHGAREPQPLLPTGATPVIVEVSGLERWFAYTYPAVPTIWLGDTTKDGYARFRLEVGTARNWYFHVPPGTRRFLVRAKAAYDTDSMHIEICAPDRVQSIIYGREGAVEVNVPEGLDGKLWHIRTDIGGATRIVTSGNAGECRYLGIDMTLDLKGVPGWLSPTWEQWFDLQDPKPAGGR